MSVPGVSAKAVAAESLISGRLSRKKPESEKSINLIVHRSNTHSRFQPLQTTYTLAHARRASYRSCGPPDIAEKSTSGRDTCSEIRHIQCIAVKNINRNLDKFSASETYYRDSIRSEIRQAQIRQIVKTVILIICSICLYDVITFAFLSHDDSHEESNWFAKNIGRLLGIEDRIFY